MTHAVGPLAGMTTYQLFVTTHEDDVVEMFGEDEALDHPIEHIGAPEALVALGAGSTLTFDISDASV